MNLETKITIYKFTPQVFTLTHKFLSTTRQVSFHRGGKILLVRKTTTMTYRVRVLSTDARRLRKDA